LPIDEAMSTMSETDRWYARRLPDDFVARCGDAYQRMLGIVTENWWAYDKTALIELVESLAPIVRELTTADEITEKHRNRCEVIVAGWMARQ